MNITMANSGLGSFDFVAADIQNGVEFVELASSCNDAGPLAQLSCLKSALEGRRNAVSADIVVAVARAEGKDVTVGRR